MRKKQQNYVPAKCIKDDEVKARFFGKWRGYTSEILKRRKLHNPFVFEEYAGVRHDLFVGNEIAEIFKIKRKPDNHDRKKRRRE